MNSLSICQWRTERLTLRTRLAPRSTVAAAFDDRPPFSIPGWLTCETREHTDEAIILENEFLEVTLIPALGFRVHRVYLKDAGSDLFLFNDALQPTPVRKGFVSLPGGLQFDGLTNRDAGKAPSLTLLNAGSEPADNITAVLSATLPPFSPTWMVDDSIPGEVTAWMDGTDRLNSLHWTVGFRLCSGSRALETEVYVHNMGTTVQQCLAIWRATMPWSESLRTIQVVTPPLRTPRSNPHQNARNDEGRESDSPFPRSPGPEMEAWSGVYDEERDSGIIHVSHRAGLSHPHAGVPHAIFQSNSRSEHSTGHAYIPYQIGPAMGVNVEPEEMVSWKDTWVPFAGIGCPCAVDSPVLVGLNVSPEPSASTRQPTNPAVFDFGLPEADENSAESETWMMALTAWKETPPVYVALEQTGEPVWSDRLALSPGQIERTQVKLARNKDYALNLVRERHNLEEASGGSVRHPKTEIYPFSAETDKPPAEAALPSHSSPYYYRGLWELAHGETESARHSLERAYESGSPWSDHPPLLYALARCLWRPSAFNTANLTEPSERDFTRAATLLDRAITADAQDVDLLLERDELGEFLLEHTAERLARLEAAPPSVRSISDVAVRMAHLLLQSGDYDQAIKLLEAQAATGAAPEVLALYRDALLGRALRLMVQWEMEPALEDIERALDDPAPYGLGGRMEHSHAELLWWAGLCCYRMGRNFHARGYWQGAAAARAPAVSIHGVCKALATGALGGTSQSLALLEAIVDAAAESEECDSPGRGRASTSAEAALSSALALYALGETRAAEMRLEMLAAAYPDEIRADWYQQAAGAGLLERI